MKKIKITYFLIAYLTSFTSFQLKPVYSSATILNCNSKIPKGVPCLIKASTYSVEIEKVDICPKNPFPDFRTTPDYAGSLCLNLYDKKINSGKLIINFPLFLHGKREFVNGNLKCITTIISHCLQKNL